MRKVLRFLEVDDTAKIDVMDANPSLLIRSQQLDKVMHAVSVGRGPVSRAAKASGQGASRRSGCARFAHRGASAASSTASLAHPMRA